MNRVAFLRLLSAAVVLGAVTFSGAGQAAPQLPRLGPLGVDLDGAWDGMLQTANGTLPITFSITTVDGKSTIAVDILEQNARDIPVNAASRSGDKLRFEVAALDGVFEGTVSPTTGAMQGTWIQVGKRLPLGLKRRSE
ncbi:MAG: hypothetical protein K1X51_13055 [Rhodospirillaceae bacterium]|nr:hypothetical protein [Rhodospirillaceae bacterium]